MDSESAAKLQRLMKLVEWRESCKREIGVWLDLQSSLGHLVQASDAPVWAQYVKSEIDVNDYIRELHRMWTSAEAAARASKAMTNEKALQIARDVECRDWCTPGEGHTSRCRMLTAQLNETAGVKP